MNNSKKKLEKLILQINEIPTLPIVSQRIMEVAGNSNASFKEVARLIEQDQSLATKILRVANSPFYGILGRVDSIDHALAILGTKEVEAIVIGASVYSFFSDGEGKAFDRKRFWRHSIVCSQISKMLASHFNIHSNESIFLAGLIHDIGKVVIDQYLHADFLAIVNNVTTKHITFSAAEKIVLGTTHYQVAAKLLERWKFPKKVVTQVLYHHAPWYDRDEESGSILIYLANILTKMSGYACHPEERQLDLDEFCQSPQAAYVSKNGFEINRDAIQKLLTHIHESIASDNGGMLSFLE